MKEEEEAGQATTRTATTRGRNLARVNRELDNILMIISKSEVKLEI